MFQIEYQQWAGSNKERVWKRWKGPFATRDAADVQLAREEAIWPNDNFRVEPIK